MNLAHELMNQPYQNERNLNRYQTATMKEISGTSPALGMRQLYTEGQVFQAESGTRLYDLQGELTGALAFSGGYQIHKVSFVKGRQYLQLGNDCQWVKVEN